MNDYSRVAIENVLNTMRVAFMMAWHPRIGEFSLIKRYVAKDVARLIAKQYLTVERLMISSNEQEIFRGKEFKYPMLTAEPDVSGINQSSWEKEKLFYVRESLILRPIIIQLSGICLWNEQFDEGSLQSMFMKVDEKHTTLLKSINSAIGRAVTPKKYRVYNPPFKFDERYDNNGSFSIKLNEGVKKVRVFDAKNKKVSVLFGEAFSQGWFNNNPKVTLILELPHFISMRMARQLYVAKFPKQFLVYRNDPTECLFKADGND